MNKFTICEMNEEDRPREKMMNIGTKNLTNTELLAILIRTGDKNLNAVELSSRILKFCGGIRGLVDISVEELCNIDGVGPAKSSVIKAAIEIGRRISDFKPEKLKIQDPKDVYKYYMESMRYLKKEVFKIVLLNTKNEIIKDVDVSIGSLNSSIVHPREVFSEAIRASANSMILIHNHPSGNCTPSREDIIVTKRLCETGEIVGINVLDHIIIGDGAYISLKAEELF